MRKGTRIDVRVLALLLAMLLALSGCGNGAAEPPEGTDPAPPAESQAVLDDAPDDLPGDAGDYVPDGGADDPGLPDGDRDGDQGGDPEPAYPAYSGYSDEYGVPEFTGEPYVILNGNVPSFGPADVTVEAFETYSELDSFGRCGVAYANICEELMPTDARESISSVKPSGWHNAEYDFVDGGYVYNRCHLIGFQLAGENANKLNLITGTRYLNIEGMLPFENMVADYVRETGGHVLYRVTPVFWNEELVCRGVRMEGFSVEDGGASVCFNIYAYNAQPGVEIDYMTGYTSEGGSVPKDYEPSGGSAWARPSSGRGDPASDGGDGAPEPQAPAKDIKPYAINTKSGKFHDPGCTAAASMSEANRRDVEADRDDLIAQGYEPCGICDP